MKTKNFRIDLWKISILVMAVLLIVGFSIIFVFVRHKLKVNSVFNQVTDCVGNPDMTMFGDYNGQTVKIAYENRDVIWNAITDKNIIFSSADKIPATDPIIIKFGDELELDIYQMEDFNVFVRHMSGEKVYYYIIKGTCNFFNLEKMVSLEGWYTPNTKFTHLGGKLSD
jgi:hypothetical protein